MPGHWARGYFALSSGAKDNRGAAGAAILRAAGLHMELITGGTGLVGSHLLLERASEGVPIKALVRTSSDRSIVERIFKHYRADWKPLLASIAWVEGDLEDIGSLQDAMSGVELVYHAAALVSFDPRDKGRLWEVNTEGTANIVNAALHTGVERLCHISSTAAIGSAPPGVERHEELPWSSDRDLSPYALSKYAAELEVYRGIAEGLDAMIVNPCVIIGPGVKGRSSMALVERLQRGTKFHPPGTNAVVDARDVAACAAKLMHSGKVGERYLLVGENVDYKVLFGELSDAFGLPRPNVELPSWSLELAWRFEHLRTLFGGRPLVTRQTARSGCERRSWSSKKVQDTIAHSFKGLKEMSANVAAFAEGRVRY